MKHSCRHRRRGLLVTISAESDMDDKKIQRSARKFGLPLQAGYGRHQLVLDMSEQGQVLVLVLRDLFGEDLGQHIAERLFKSVAKRFNLKKEE